MQITVNETDIQITNGKLIINIDSDLEKVLNSNKMVLSSVEPGRVFNNKYIILEHFDDGTTAVIRKELLDKKMRFGSTNDWRICDLRNYLNLDYLKEVGDEFGKENIIEHKVNLLSMDGLDDYGTCRDKISLFDIDKYRKYRKILGKNMDCYWYLLAPDSTPSGWSDNCVLIVGDGGSVGYGVCDCDDGGVRPFWVGRRSKVRETLKLESRYQKNRQPFLSQKRHDKYKGTQYYDRN